MKNFFARIFALWAAIVFSITLILILLPILLCGLWKEPKRSVIMQYIFQFWMTLFFTFSFVWRTYTGRKHFKKGENYVVVCNHNSFLDPPLSSPGIPGANKTIAKEEMARIPIFGIVYTRGSVLVNRKSEESRKASYAKMKEVLAMGMHMCIYPEGTRNKSGQPLQRFHDGAFKLAVDSGKAVIPAILTNTAKVLPADKGFYFWPHPVSMHFLAPIPSAGKSVAALREEVFAIMEREIIAKSAGRLKDA